MPSRRSRSSTRGEYVSPEQHARREVLAQLRVELRRAREQREPWYLWILDRAAATHRHELHDDQGRAIACPVYDCDARRGSEHPHLVQRTKRRRETRG